MTDFLEILGKTVSELLEMEKGRLIALSDKELARLPPKVVMSLNLPKKRLENILEILYSESLYDRLTGLLRSERFKEVLDAKIASISRSRNHGVREPGVFGLGDIDDFKKYNRRYTHIGGDYLLMMVAYYLRIVLRKGDVIGRYGGEEFGFILSDVFPYVINQFRRLKDEIQAQTEVTMSFGIVDIPTLLNLEYYRDLLIKSRGEGKECTAIERIRNALVHAASTAVSHAKQQPGKNRIVVAKISYIDPSKVDPYTKVPETEYCLSIV